MLQNIPVVRARYLERFCETLRTYDTDPYPFLDSVGLSARLADNPEAWIPLSQLLNFIELAVQETGHVRLGLDTGIRPRLRHSKFSQIVLYSPTLYQALRKICTNSALEDTSAKFRVVRTSELGWIECGTISSSCEATRQLETFRYAAILEIIRSAAGPHWLPPRANFGAPEHPEILRSPLLEGVDTRFSQKGLSIAVEPDLLSQPMIRIPKVPTTRSEFDDSPIQFFTSLREVIRTQILANKPGITGTAKALQMSERSLQRRLHEQGITFLDLQTDVRIETAKTWLEETEDPISTIAANLAYAHSTHFSRAFTRTCGVTPREYRRTHQSRTVE